MKEENEMTVSINVKRKFKINGKEYNSIEEMPDDVRETFKKAMASQADSGHQTNPAAMRTRIIFNGMEYESMDAMPQDVRQLYEKVLRAAETGTASPEIDLADISSGMPREPSTLGTAYPGDIPQPAKFEPSFSPRTLIVSAVLGALFLLLYYLWQSR
jgi:hypothetical protein